MTVTTISQLKLNPSSVIAQAVDYPVAVANRSTIQAYLIGKKLYERMVSLLEDAADRAVIAKTDVRKGKDFERVAQELGI